MDVWQWLRSGLTRGAQWPMFQWRADLVGLDAEQRFEVWQRLMWIERFMNNRKAARRDEAQSLPAFVILALEDLCDG